jgi:hypothetical protein
MKDQLLKLIADTNQQAAIGPRLARVNLRIRALAEAQAQQPKDWCRHFFEAASRLLDPGTFEILKREATRRENEGVRQQPAPPSPAGPPTPPAQEPQAPARLANLAEVAAVRAIKFDPTRLFKEFGREKVLTLWAGLLPEDRPETAAGLRRLLVAPTPGAGKAGTP